MKIEDVASLQYTAGDTVCELIGIAVLLKNLRYFCTQERVDPPFDIETMDRKALDALDALNPLQELERLTGKISTAFLALVCETHPSLFGPALEQEADGPQC